MYPIDVKYIDINDKTILSYILDIYRNPSSCPDSWCAYNPKTQELIIAVSVYIVINLKTMETSVYDTLPDKYRLGDWIFKNSTYNSNEHKVYDLESHNVIASFPSSTNGLDTQVYPITIFEDALFVVYDWSSLSLYTEHQQLISKLNLGDYEFNIYNGFVTQGIIELKHSSKNIYKYYKITRNGFEEISFTKLPHIIYPGHCSDCRINPSIYKCNGLQWSRDIVNYKVVYRVYDVYDPNNKHVSFRLSDFYSSQCVGVDLYPYKDKMIGLMSIATRRKVSLRYMEKNSFLIYIDEDFKVRTTPIVFNTPPQINKYSSIIVNDYDFYTTACWYEIPFLVIDLKEAYI